MNVECGRGKGCVGLPGGPLLFEEVGEVVTGQS